MGEPMTGAISLPLEESKMQQGKRKAETVQNLVPITSTEESAPIPMRAELTTAILVDGGFYRRRAKKLFGFKSPEDRAKELVVYCRRHIKQSKSRLYRIFYYDCPPSSKTIYHPLLKKPINLGKTDDYNWMTTFHSELVTKRKVALRRGEVLESQSGYQLRPEKLKKLLSGAINIADLTEKDFTLDITQKGVDMRMGLDIANLALNRNVNQIIMIAGDSDFVPAAKHARRAGIDFILDPMWANISSSLHEHIDGLFQSVRRPPSNLLDPLHSENMKNPADEKSLHNTEKEDWE